MHLLIISDQLNPSLEHKSSLALDHLAYWVDKGTRITVIAPRSAKTSSTGVDKFVMKHHYPEYDIITVKNLFNASGNKVARIFNQILFGIMALGLGVSQKDWDAVISAVPSTLSGFVGVILGKLHSKPIIAEINHWQSRARKQINGQRATKNSRLVKWITSLSDYIVLTGEKSIEKYETIPTHPVTINIPEGYRLNFTSISPPDRQFFSMEKGAFKVGYIGALDTEHYLDNIIQTAKSFENLSSIHFYLVGDGPYKQILEKRILHESITNVSLYGAQNQDSIISVVAQMDVIVYLAEKNASLTIPESLLTGMALEKPLITGQDSIFQKTVTQSKTGLIVNGNSVYDLHNAIEKLYQDSSLREKLGKNGREYILHTYLSTRIDFGFKSLYNSD